MSRRRRWAASLAVVLAAAVAGFALAAPTVDTGSMSVTGIGAGAVAVTGRVVVLGSVSNSRAQLEIDTLHSAATLGAAGRTRKIQMGHDVFVTLPAGAFFGVTANSGQIRVVVHGKAISATIAGAGAVGFTGHGTYTFGYPPITRAWPKGPLTLRQPAASVMAHVPAHGKVAHAPTAA